MHNPPVITDFPPMQIVSIARQCEVKDIANVLGELYGKLAAYCEVNSLELTGPPVCFYYSFDETYTELEAALQVNKAGALSPVIENKTIPAQKVVFVDYFGHYDNLMEGWDALFMYLDEAGIEPTGPTFEVYFTDPGGEPDPNKWRTGIYSPC